MLLAAAAFASDVGVYPAVPPPTSLHPFDQPSAVSQDGTTAAPAPVRPDARNAPAPRGRFDPPVDPVTGVVTAPGYMGPRAAKGQ
jgi:hypothetical protein